ncbi:ATP-binding cassette domain-containing protein [Vibrio hippocampi]|uniref:Fe(3+) ions import ATP-binding protein FbpC n=1 Tax=Vibrio hippocampi TaxID=654686 RepID=A0ABM8ZH90_9VIBR|nr:ATP-binding cassette domain-containing protein [Vibrio hippocampi]CAH0525640.1 Fe(3+) ions import ATP-binding protein FbpC [Vibrio hippocampi]
MPLTIENLTILNHQGQPLLSDFDLSVGKGEIVTIMGPSGCGKSTLLNMIAGHLCNDFSYQGSISISGTDLTQLPAHKRQVGILFQDDLLFPHLNVWQNLAFALPNAVKGETRKQQALAALEEINLSNLAEHYPEQLSGGQRARVSLTRMLLAQPKLALLDEPFSKLDKELRIQFRDWVAAQLSAANIPTLLVTHDVQDAPTQGRIIDWTMEVNHA